MHKTIKEEFNISKINASEICQKLEFIQKEQTEQKAVDAQNLSLRQQLIFDSLNRIVSEMCVKHLQIPNPVPGPMQPEYAAQPKAQPTADEEGSVIKVM